MTSCEFRCLKCFSIYHQRGIRCLVEESSTIYLSFVIWAVVVVILSLWFSCLLCSSNKFPGAVQWQIHDLLNTNDHPRTSSPWLLVYLSSLCKNLWWWWWKNDFLQKAEFAINLRLFWLSVIVPLLTEAVDYSLVRPLACVVTLSNASWIWTAIHAEDACLPYCWFWLIHLLPHVKNDEKFCLTSAYAAAPVIILDWWISYRTYELSH